MWQIVYLEPHPPDDIPAESEHFNGGGFHGQNSVPVSNRHHSLLLQSGDTVLLLWSSTEIFIIRKYLGTIKVTFWHVVLYFLVLHCLLNQNILACYRKTTRANKELHTEMTCCANQKMRTFLSPHLTTCITVKAEWYVKFWKVSALWFF